MTIKNKMGEIILSDDEVSFITLLAQARFKDSRNKNRKRFWLSGQTEKDELNDDILGTAGEFVFCKAYEIEFDPTIWNSFGEVGDVLGIIQVRTTNKLYGRLIIRDKDNVSHIYVLIIGNIPSFRVVGWRWGSDFLDDAWVKNPGGHGAAWFIPSLSLRAPEELLPIIMKLKDKNVKKLGEKAEQFKPGPEILEEGSTPSPGFAITYEDMNWAKEDEEFIDAGQDMNEVEEPVDWGDGFFTPHDPAYCEGLHCPIHNPREREK
jgi:hypothetical protein